MRRVLLLGLMLGLAGCRGFGRVHAAGAYDTANRAGQSGYGVGVDGVFALEKVKWVDGKTPFPFGLHTSLDAIVAPERQALGWGTGLAYFPEPLPVSPFVVLGTSAHVDRVRGKFSAGSLSPYGEIGLRASVPARYERGQGGLFLTLGLAGYSSLNYLNTQDALYDAFFLVRFGVGWEVARTSSSAPPPSP